MSAKIVLPVKSYRAGAGFKPNMVMYHSRSKPLYVMCDGKRYEVDEDGSVGIDGYYCCCRIYNGQYDLFYNNITKEARVTRYRYHEDSYTPQETLKHIYKINIS